MRDADVVVSAFATPPSSARRAIAQPFDQFDSDVEVVVVDPAPGEGSEAGRFSAAADQYREGNFILKRLLRERLRGVRVRRIALVGFSAGCAFVQAVLKSGDADYIDTVIALDGMHIAKLYDGSFAPTVLAPWVDFGVRAAIGGATNTGPLFVNAHTAIRLGQSTEKLVGNTTDSANAVTAQVAANSPGAARIGFNTDELLMPPPPPAVTLTINRPIAPGQSIPITRTWDAMPLPDSIGRGHYYVLDYGGNGEPDHVFIAWYVQGAIWRTFVKPRWAAGVSTCVAPMGLGVAHPECGPEGVLVPDGMYPVPEESHWGWALAGAALGTALGFWAGQGVRPGRRAAWDKRRSSVR